MINWNKTIKSLYIKIINEPDFSTGEKQRANNFGLVLLITEDIESTIISASRFIMNTTGIYYEM